MGKLELPKDIEASMLSLAADGRAAWKRGDVTAAETAYLAAWEMIPEPRLEYDYASSLSRGLVDFFRDTRQFDKARQWLVTAKKVYGDQNPEMWWQGGVLAFEAGDLDEAFSFFKKLHDAYGERPFREYDRKYLTFYKQRSRNRIH